ncbi:MAG: cytochrome c1 [Prolixibacteraceae bacterium]|nr:cytochrome c1 [Burkholderiales bacterium]
MKKVFFTVLFFPFAVFAAGDELRLDRANIDPHDAISIQRGARVFVNYCLNCHAATAMRYIRLTDLGLTEQQIRENLLFTADKVGDPMMISASRKDQRQWFGVEPPDLSVVARSRGTDWLYTYLRTFYRDEKSATGWNNLAFPNVAMPHALWQLQGSQALKTTSEELAGHKVEHKTLVLEHPGSLSALEFDKLTRDLVNFLSYMGEPEKTKRSQIGIVVLLFLLLLLLPAWLLKKEYWKDVH